MFFSVTNSSPTYMTSLQHSPLSVANVESVSLITDGENVRPGNIYGHATNWFESHAATWAMLLDR